jgi:hypothetical protein
MMLAFMKKKKKKRKINAKPRQLRTLQHCPEHIQMENQSFPVPKSLFINICNLKKNKNRVQASVALEADLRASDIDICVVLACKQTLRERTSAVKHQNWDSAPLHQLIKNFPLFARPLA